jgi:large subunit ribosomal protein L23
MALSIYHIIKGPVISNKAYKVSQQNKVVLRVHVDANAPMIKEAVKHIFGVEVVKVNTLYRKKKSRKRGRVYIEGATVKHAYVTLKEG